MKMNVLTRGLDITATSTLCALILKVVLHVNARMDGPGMVFVAQVSIAFITAEIMDDEMSLLFIPGKVVHNQCPLNLTIIVSFYTLFATLLCKVRYRYKHN